MRRKVKENSNLLRDDNTNAILNNNITEYQNYLNVKRKNEIEQKRIKKLESDVTNIKNDMKDMKDMLSTIIQKINNN